MQFVAAHEAFHAIHSGYYGGDDPDRFSTAQKEVIADACAAAYMKHEMGHEGAFGIISRMRGRDNDTDYPFDKYAKELESLADEHWHAEGGIQEALAKIVTFAEKNVPGPEAEVRAVAAARTESVAPEALAMH